MNVDPLSWQEAYWAPYCLANYGIKLPDGLHEGLSRFVHATGRLPHAPGELAAYLTGWEAWEANMAITTVVVPLSRNLGGILKDTASWMAENGLPAPSHLTVVRLPRDEELVPAMPGGWCPAVTFVVAGDYILARGPVICVLNGGTTRQQWEVGKVAHGVIDRIGDETYGLRPTDHDAIIVLGAQRDGVTVLAEMGDFIDALEATGPQAREDADYNNALALWDMGYGAHGERWPAGKATADGSKDSTVCRYQG